MKFIHAIVFDKGEYDELRDFGIEGWDDLKSGDYIVHALYSIDNKEVLILDDNTHQPVEAMIEKFLEGIEFCGHDAVVTKAIVVVNDSYSWKQTCEALSSDNYVEVG